MGVLSRKAERVRRQARPAGISILWKPLRDPHYVVASLQPGGGGLRQIFVQQSTLRELQALARNPEQSIAGLLLGRRLDCSVTSTPYVLIESHVDVTLSSLDERVIAGEIQALRGKVARRKSIEVLGWFCASRSPGAAVSPAHAAIHSACFEERWQTILNFASGGKAGAFFLYDFSAARWFHAPFYEVTDSKPASRAPRPTCVAWPAYLTTANIVPLATEPVSPPPRDSLGVARPAARVRRAPASDPLAGVGRAAEAARRSALDLAKSLGGVAAKTSREASETIERIRAERAAIAARRKAEADADRVRAEEQHAKEAAERRAAREEAKRREAELEEQRAKEAAEHRAAREEAKRREAELEKQRAAEADALRAKKAEARRKAAEEAERVRAAEVEAKRKAAEAEAEAKRKAAEEAERRRAVEAEAKRQAAEAQARRRAEEADKRRAAEAEARRLAAEEAERKAAEEAQRKAALEAQIKAAKEEARKKAAEEARRKAAEAEQRRVAAADEARREAEEEEKRRAAAAETRRQAAEAAARRRAAEAEARRVAEAEAEARRRAEAEAQARREEEEAEARRLAEAEARQRAREAEARRMSEEAEARRIAEAVEARRKAEEDAEEERRKAAVAEVLRISVEVAAMREKLARAPAPVEGGKPKPARAGSGLPDVEDTTASDGPYRYLALARREGFEVTEKIERGTAEQPETIWLLHESEFGLRLIVVTTDETVREASLHYNLRSTDGASDGTTALENNGTEPRTVYGREDCLQGLRSRCRRLRATGALERDWKVAPTAEDSVTSSL